MIVGRVKVATMEVQIVVDSKSWRYEKAELEQLWMLLELVLLQQTNMHDSTVSLDKLLLVPSRA